MEHHKITKALAGSLPEMEKLPALSHLPTEFVRNLSKTDKEILLVKYNGLRFSMMDENSLAMAANMAVYKISVITGWSIPSDATYQDALIAELINKFRESYSDMTAAELLYAFRNHASAVEDYGKALNLQLMDKVVAAYKIARQKVSAIEETQYKTEQRIFTEDELMDGYREDAERCYQMFISRIPLRNAEILRPILTLDFKLDTNLPVIQFFIACIQAGKTNLYVKSKE